MDDSSSPWKPSLGIMLCLATGVWACGDRSAVREEPIKPAATSSQEPVKPFPHLEPDQVWVSSVPAGLRLYVDGAAEEKFLKGLTPQSVSLAPGPHTVTVVTAPGVEPIVDRSRGLIEASRVPLPDGAIAVSVGIKQPEKPLSVIVLAYPEGVTHDRLGDHYPRDVMFAPPPGGRAAIYGMMGVPDALRGVVARSWREAENTAGP